ncbi:MAG: rare lipoprotein A, partial [Bermanella sp.]
MLMLLQACSTSRYKQAIDSTPVFHDQIVTLIEPIPKREGLSRRGNAYSYEVWGKTYEVDRYIKEYSASGTASWYGQKFHGHDTSNGEKFDVYKFTAAHKSLPLPSYVRVTNSANQKSLIVRVNDRGPFHGDRLIDLSYAAAVRLGFADSGTANVEIELVAAPLTEGEYEHLQVAAFQAKSLAVKLQN